MTSPSTASVPSVLSSERPVSRPWQEMAVLAGIGMEAIVVTLWFRILSQTGAYISFWKAFAVLLSIYLLAYSLARGLLALRLLLTLRRVLMGIGLLFSLWLALRLLLYPSTPGGILGLVWTSFLSSFQGTFKIPGDLPVILIVLFLYWRGLSQLGEYFGPISFQNRFSLGSLALVGYGLIAPLTGEVLSMAVYLYIFLGLTGMGAGRISTSTLR